MWYWLNENLRYVYLESDVDKMRIYDIYLESDIDIMAVFIFPYNYARVESPPVRVVLGAVPPVATHTAPATVHSPLPLKS